MGVTDLVVDQGATLRMRNDEADLTVDLGAVLRMEDGEGERVRWI
jgi:hypothetical protein